MQTPKEALLARMRGEKSDFVPEFYSTTKDLVFPGDRYIDLEHFDPYGTGPDAWGVMWTNQGPDPMIDGNTVAKDFRLFEDMEDWKEHVHFPPIDFMPVEDILNGMAHGMGYNPEEHALSVLILSGQFERMNEMVGFENALCAFYECPDEVHEFFDAMCEYKLKCIDRAYNAVHPQIIHMHDDWGTNNNMFFDPEIWREFIKPNEKKYADRIHELGMVYMHHSCGFIEQIFPDLIEIGVDAINPVNVCMDTDMIMEKYADKITIVGTVDNQLIDKESTSEEEIRNEVRTKIEKYGKYDRFIPFIIPATQRGFKIFVDEAVKTGRQMVTN
ncbi:MAG: hypothetical protein E7242_07790 [Lachnospiraceae bacterium]|nr:hypothetical protein [Lachnospiraceae bacterium]